MRRSGWRTAGLDLNPSDTDLPLQADVSDRATVAGALRAGAFFAAFLAGAADRAGLSAVAFAAAFTALGASTTAKSPP